MKCELEILADIIRDPAVENKRKNWAQDHFDEILLQNLELKTSLTTDDLPELPKHLFE